MVGMLASLQTAPRREPGGWPGGLVLAAFCFCVANIVALVSTFGPWLLSADGMHVSTDFLGFWPAGRMVLDGQAAAVYDVVAHKAASVAALGRDFEGNYPIYYPPHFFLLLAVVALMPYGVSYLAWVALTLVSYVFVISRIIGHPTGILLACAFPALLANAIAGQNGCLTAALFGGALLAMERRPILAGFLFALAELQAAVRNSHSARADMRRPVARVRVSRLVHIVACACVRSNSWNRRVDGIF